MTDKPSNFLERVGEQIWFAGGLLASMAVIAIGFGLASYLLSWAYLGLLWLFSRPLAWLFGW